MKLITYLLSTKERKGKRKSLAEYKQELLSRQGRAQFEKLVSRGLGIPVALF